MTIFSKNIFGGHGPSPPVCAYVSERSDFQAFSFSDPFCNPV